MRLLVASDIHGSLAAVKRLRAAAGRLNPDMLVLLGDNMPRQKPPCCSGNGLGNRHYRSCAFGVIAMPR